MSPLSRELVFLILQFLDEEKYKETVHKLEQESAYYFNMRYFEEKLLAGEWEEVEKYLSGFTKVDDNRFSMKIFFEIRKQKYLEALDGKKKGKALDILTNDLRVFAGFNEDLFKEITQLLALDNFRENEQLAKYVDANTARNIMLVELKKLIEVNPLTRDKLVLPSFKSSRLRTLINQSLNWQHQLCKNPRPNPDIKTLFTDHSCNAQSGTFATTLVSIPAAPVTKPMGNNPPGAHGPFQPTNANPSSGALAGWMGNATGSSSIQAAVATTSPLPLSSNQASMLKRPITPPATLGMVEYQPVDHEPLMKRFRPSQSVDEVTYPTVRQQAAWSLDDLPRTLVFTLHQGSTVTSLDFHPSRQTLLLVGCLNGEITLWEAGVRQKLNSIPFKIWNLQACTTLFQATAKSALFSVTRVAWCPDGNVFGVTFSKNLVHLYAYAGPNDVHQHLEIDAHAGGVNDIAFAYANKQLCVITCGDDKLIQVWDLMGKRLFSFEGHEAPVYSVCAHQKEHIQFIFSIAVDGKIKAWLYDNLGSRVDYCAPGRWCTAMRYSTDGRRLFSCGTSKEGESYLVEWNESEGAIKRTYIGLIKKSGGVVQFDTTQNRFLAVGEDNQIKFWDMDNVNLLTNTNAGGGLPNFPRLKFNKEGNLLAVTTVGNGVKILANASGMRAIRTVEEILRSSLEAATVKVVGSSAGHFAPGFSVVNAAPRSSVVNAAPGSSAGHFAPGSSVVNAAPGSSAGHFAPGFSVANAAPASSAANAAPGSSAANAAPGSSAANAAPGSSAANATPEASVPNAAPGSSAANATPEASVPNAVLGAPAPNVAHVSHALALIAPPPGYSSPNVSPATVKMEGSSTVGPSTVVNGVDSIVRSVEKPEVLDDVNDKLKPWCLTEIADPTQCRMVTMPDTADASNKVARLLYTNSGIGIMALGSNGTQKLWKWRRDDSNPTGKATTLVTPPIWHPNNGLVMTNDTSGVNLEEAVPCMALSKNDSYVMSAIGGKVSLFNMMTFRVMATFMPPPPKSSFLAFHPIDNNVIAVGMEDSTIHIYNVRVDEVTCTLEGHQERISSLAFSTILNVLVSSGADAQLCFWNIDTWEKRNSVAVEVPAGKTPNGDTEVQFSLDQIQMLVTHETQLAIYDASTYERICQWIPHDTLSAPISCATYSCNSQLVFASFCDGSIGIFDADTLRLRCRITPSAYMSPVQLNGSQVVHPLAIVAHPQEPNQFAVGLTDGSVKVIEPLESENRWGVSPPAGNDGLPNGRPDVSPPAGNDGLPNGRPDVSPPAGNGLPNGRPDASPPAGNGLPNGRPDASPPAGNGLPIGRPDVSPPAGNGLPNGRPDASSAAQDDAPDPVQT